jgi:4-amino-4-deoxy-L-arabinose transferase-like glycosyltransferase
MTDSLTSRVYRYRFFILAAITALGAIFRLYQITVLPPGDGYDTAQYGLDALQILDGARPIFLAANFGREALFSYLVALVYLFTGPGALGIHLSSALIGIATIPAVYFAARELLGGEKMALQVWVPLLAALVTAVSYWHLNYSRAGLRVIWVPLFAALVTAFLWRGLRCDTRPSLVAAGLLLGLSQYTYQAARLMPLLVLAGFLLTYLSRRSFTQTDLINMLLTFGLALLVFAPLGFFAYRHPEIFNDRLRQTALLEEGTNFQEQAAAVADQALITLRMFFIEGDNEPLYTIPRRPSLNPFLALAFIAGILAALWRWKKPAMLYLLAWLILLTTPAMIADQAATAKRALSAFPAVAILIALGLVVPYLLLTRRTTGRSKGPDILYTMLVTLGLLWTTYVTYNDYFIRWGQDPALPAHYQRDHTEVGMGIASIPQEDAVLISPFPADHPAIQLNSLRHPNMRSYDGHRCLLIPDSGGRPLYYFIVPGETERSLEELSALFPNGIIEEGPTRPDRDESYYLSFTVPQVAPAQIAGQDDLIINWADQIGLHDFSIAPQNPVPGDMLTVTLTYRAFEDLDIDYTAYLHLLDQQDSNPVLLAQVDSQPCGGALPTTTWRAGDIIRDTLVLHIPEETLSGTYQLAAGFYTWPDLTPLAAVGDNQGYLTTLEIK